MTMGWTPEEEEELAEREKLFQEYQEMLYESDVSFAKAVEIIELLEKNSSFGFRHRDFHNYVDGWQCACGVDLKGICGVQFTRSMPATPPAQGTVHTFGRPKGLPAALYRDGTRYWYPADATRSEQWSRKQQGIDGPIVLNDTALQSGQSLAADCESK